MENVYKLLQTTFNVLLFFLAVSLLYGMSRRYISLTDAAADAVSYDNTLYEAYDAEAAHYTTKTELIALLLGNLEYDTDIVDAAGTYTINADGYSPGEIGTYDFRSKEYKKTYVYNLNGTISKIVYRYVSR